jgi:ATP-dependent Lon protease
MATALLSLAKSVKIRDSLAMTGELTLTGQVLAVGGIREKVIAARRSRVTTLILPAANRDDYEGLPAYLRKGITAHFAAQYSDVFDIAFDGK